MHRFGFHVLLCISFLGILGIAGAPLSVHAQDLTDLGFASQANFIANFPKFVEWPSTAFDSPQASLVICIFGHKEFAASVASITQDEIINGRGLRVVWAPKLSDLHLCHILYIGQAETENRRTLMDAVLHANVLTIGETPGFLENGGALEFAYEDRLRFDVNLGPIASAGLRIDSHLLALAGMCSLSKAATHHPRPSNRPNHFSRPAIEWRAGRT